MNRFKEIQSNLNNMAPENKDMKELESVRYNHLKLTSRRDGHKEFLNRETIRTNNIKSGDFVMGSDKAPISPGSARYAAMNTTMDSIDTNQTTET